MPIPDEDKVLLHARDIEAADLPDWRMLFETLRARFDTGDFAKALRLADVIGEAAEQADHHPDLDVRYGHLNVRLLSHDVRGVTQRDLRLARTISELAAGLGAPAVLEGLQTVELALDVDDRDVVKPFWASVLGLKDHDVELVDPDGAQHTVWFQRTQADEQRWHLDVRVPPEQVQARIQAALDAGGTLVTDEFAPRFWVLADARGNKACFTTWQGRD
jgi:4a-hydroxytetrahydrobiopterin dehydratase